MTDTLWTRPVAHLRDAFAEAGIRRAFIVTDPATGEVRPSHEVVQPLASAIAADRRDYRGHQAVFFEIGPESGHLLTAFLHRTVRGQAAGGLRFWGYPSVEALVRDGLRLSAGMGDKSALAGLWWGGGKGIVVRDPGRDATDPAARRAVFTDYGRFITSLAGCYVTAEDAGTTPDDLRTVFAATRHTTCVPPDVGGSGNPSRLTAAGVVVAMEAALAHRGQGDLAGKTIAMQGLGNVAGFMIEGLLARGIGRIVAADISAVAIERTRIRFPGAPLDLSVVQPGDDAILAEPCDIVAPCALGASLNERTIAALQADIVCGAANNQLEDPARDGRALADRGITYVPDFLANRMGIVNCANEQYGVIPDDPAVTAHLSRDTPFGIYRRTLEILARAAEAKTTPHAEAIRLADELSAEPHPIWGNRGQVIIDRLVAGGWAG